MSDLIDRQDAKDVVDMELDAIDHVPELVYDRLLTALDKVPSAQPSQIHCYECKHYDTQECMGRNAFYGLKDDDYCSWAELGDEQEE